MISESAESRPGGISMRISFAVKGALLLLLSPLFCTIVIGAPERDPLPPRVPDKERAAAQAMKNPVAASPESIAKGKGLYEGKGTCLKCHGATGKGDGPGAKLVRPAPRNMTNPDWQKARADGEMFWIIKNGSPGTGMVALIPSDITEDDAWHIINYVRTLK
ncbi:MAG: cytochrome c [Nitrospira sp.]|nr:MAG: cytochrome c [Nitrospira sp.]